MVWWHIFFCVRKLLAGLLFVSAVLFGDQTVSHAQHLPHPQASHSSRVTLQMPLPASSARIDSLKNILAAPLTDTSRVNALIDLAREIWVTSPKEARTLASEALGIAERVGFMRGIANAFNTIGVSYFYQGWYDIALEQYQKSLAIRQQIKDIRGVGNSLNNIGLIYSAQGKYDDALKYFRQSLAVYKEAKARNPTAAAFNNMGIAYRNKKQYDSSEQMHQAALDLLQNTNNTNGLALTYNSFGTLELEKGETTRSLDLQQKAVALYRITNNHKGLVDAHLGEAKALAALTRNDAALRALDTAMFFAQSLNARKELRDCYELLANIEERIGNYSGAYYNVRRYEALKDSLFSEEADTKAAQFNAKYDAELRSKQIALLTAEKERQTLLRNVLLSAILAGVFAVGLLYNRFRLKKRSEAALQAVNAELNAKNVEIEQARFIAEQLLLNVLPKPIADRMQAGEQHIAEHFGDVSVVFIDIVDFTTLSAKVPPGELVTLLDAIFSDFDALAERFGLEKIKTIGDAYMAVCGVPVRHSEHAERVARFALEIQRTMQQYSIDDYSTTQNDASHQTIPLKVRVGVHSGEVVAGIIGKKKFSYDLWGDTVNIASRLQTHALPGEIQCSGATFAILEKKCIFEGRGKIHLKGTMNVDSFVLKGFFQSHFSENEQI